VTSDSSRVSSSQAGAPRCAVRRDVLAVVFPDRIGQCVAVRRARAIASSFRPRRWPAGTRRAPGSRVRRIPKTISPRATAERARCLARSAASDAGSQHWGTPGRSGPLLFQRLATSSSLTAPRRRAQRATVAADVSGRAASVSARRPAGRCSRARPRLAPGETFRGDAPARSRPACAASSVSARRRRSVCSSAPPVAVTARICAANAAGCASVGRPYRTYRSGEHVAGLPAGSSTSRRYRSRSQVTYPLTS